MLLSVLPVQCITVPNLNISEPRHIPSRTLSALKVESSTYSPSRRVSIEAMTRSNILDTKLPPAEDTPHWTVVQLCMLRGNGRSSNRSEQVLLLERTHGFSPRATVPAEPPVVYRTICIVLLSDLLQNLNNLRS